MIHSACQLSFTIHPDRFVASWDNNVEIAQLADALSLEAIVPYAKWKAFAEDGHYAGRTFETFAWAASTIDHISHGRFGLTSFALV